MRVMVSQNKVQDERASNRGSSEVEEEEARLAMVVEEEWERDVEEQGENLLALNFEVIANNDHLSFVDHGGNLINDKERIEVNSNLPFNTSPNVEENLNSGGCGTIGGRGGVNDLFNVENDILLGQEVRSGGPGKFILSHETVKGGVDIRFSYYEGMGRVSKPILQQENESGSLVGKKGGVYSDGPPLKPIVKQTDFRKKQMNFYNSASVLPSSSLRKQQQLVRSINSRKSNSTSANSVTGVNMSDGKGGKSMGVCLRKEAQRCTSSVVSSKHGVGSSSSAGDTLGSSSINSSNIRNCNRLFLKIFEQEVASKVWKGALALGVEENNMHVSSKGVDCIKEIQDNEKRDEVESIKREHKKFVHQ
jgi:hypothetical protein